jgi:hypothetical protein
LAKDVSGISEGDIAAVFSVVAREMCVHVRKHTDPAVGADALNAGMRLSKRQVLRAYSWC